MSILNVVFRPERVIVAVDTDTAFLEDNAGGGVNEPVRGPSAKLFPLVHLPAIIASRGYTPLPIGVFGAMAAAPSYDMIAAGFEGILDRTVAFMTTERVRLAEAAAAHHEIIAAGWSDRLSRMDATLWTNEGGAGYRAFDIGGVLLCPSPSEDSSTPVNAPVSLSEHVAIARRQAQRLRTAPGNLAGGGDLVVAELARDQVIIDVVRDFMETDRDDYMAPPQTVSRAAGVASSFGGITRP